MKKAGAVRTAEPAPQTADLIDSTGYVPWFNPIWEPPSGEIESLFFCVQTAIGAVIVGYFFGYWRGAKGRKDEE